MGGKKGPTYKGREVKGGREGKKGKGRGWKRMEGEGGEGKGWEKGDGGSPRLLRFLTGSRGARIVTGWRRVDN